MSEGSVRRRFVVRGVVQGVGFRPFVFGLATDLGLAGLVGNDTASVFIEVEGPRERLEAFARRLVSNHPPLAVIEGVEEAEMPPTGTPGFEIVESRAVPGAVTLVPPDVATCAACLEELFDPSNRRYRYPFTNCTDCGPRFTIIRELPYDRPLTTMAGFTLCPECEREYHDPRDRRFHAQPNACPVCGPRLSFQPSPGAPSESGDDPAPAVGEDALRAAQRVLADGGVVAVKGLGGFHLACDARNADAVGRLRERKGRVDKPFALIAPDVATVRGFADVGREEEALLRARQRPIVLLRALPSGEVAENVAPGNGYLGVMLPYTPLHHLLLRPAPGGDVGPDVLVLTSGNRSDEPIAFRDDEALERLGGLADAFLLHDREIHVPCDDSVVRVFEGVELPVRRSRGYAPFPVRLSFPVRPVLAVGGELKTTFCLASGEHAWVSQHIGDMENLETMEGFERSVALFRRMYRVDPVAIAADAHPAYLTARWAGEAAAALGVPLVTVQHHHAHIASLLAEHGRERPVIGVAFDGTGYGTDGAIWGGEILVADLDGFERAAHLGYVPLPGGDAAIRRPFRTALAHLWAADEGWDDHLPPVEASDAVERGVLLRQLERSVNTVPTSSMGRLFDAVASLAGVRHEVTYEAQAAMELEALVDDADGWGDGDGLEAAYRFGLRGEVVETASVIRAVVTDVRAGAPAGVIAARFHDAVAELILEVALRERERTSIGTVGLSGGVFQNVALLRRAVRALRDAGFEVLTHREVPPNDGGLALGQAAVAGRVRENR